MNTLNVVAAIVIFAMLGLLVLKVVAYTMLVALGACMVGGAWLIYRFVRMFFRHD